MLQEPCYGGVLDLLLLAYISELAGIEWPGNKEVLVQIFTQYSVTCNVCPGISLYA
jgi:hypothetical protein